MSQQNAECRRPLSDCLEPEFRATPEDPNTQKTIGKGRKSLSAQVSRIFRGGYQRQLWQAPKYRGYGKTYNGQRPV
ncbi:hypothetical protein ACFLZH_05965 [Patescibacteria group bacterium]